MFIITGQTATGKTKLALEYAQKYNGELISCDSRQAYKHLDIITGKDLKQISNISKAEQVRFRAGKYQISKRVNNFDIGFYPISINLNQSQLISKIWLYDIIDPKQSFSSFDWVKCARWVIENIKKRGKTPIIVGGTYFYLKHLLYGVATENIPPNWPLRKELENKSVRQLQQILKTLDVQSFNRLNISDKSNPRRLIRKIEIANHPNSTNISYPAYLSNPPNLKKNKWKIIGLKFKDKDQLKQAIKNRVDERLKNGAIEEVASLIKKGYRENDPGLKTIGYQQLIAYLQGKLTKEEAIHKWITAEIQYAKRQHTFMKKDPNIKWREI